MFHCHFVLLKLVVIKVCDRHLRHPHIIMILAWAKSDPQFYIVMNLVNGPTLFQALFVENSKLDVSDVVLALIYLYETC